MKLKELVASAEAEVEWAEVDFDVLSRQLYSCSRGESIHMTSKNHE